jgi:hypothetical protein
VFHKRHTEVGGNPLPQIFLNEVLFLPPSGFIEARSYQDFEDLKCYRIFFFSGLEYVGYSVDYVAHFVFLRDVWIRTQRAAAASSLENKI